jgi:cyclic pyranopterin phosphate synthase
VLARLSQRWSLKPLAPGAAGETASRWAYEDGRGEVGFVSSVTQAFCSDCNRARISTQGEMFLCLFASRGHDLRQLLRSGATDDSIVSALAAIWRGRADRYSELRSLRPQSAEVAAPRVEMHFIGG